MKKELEGQGSPDQRKSTLKSNTNPTEQGRPLSKYSASQTAKQPYDETFKNTENRIWKLLELRMKHSHGRMKHLLLGINEEYYREYDEIKVLEKELNEKGTNREKQIFELYNDLTNPVDPHHWSSRGLSGELSQEEFQQFRLDIDTLSDKRLSNSVSRMRKQRLREEQMLAKNHREFYRDLNKNKT